MKGDLIMQDENVKKIKMIKIKKTAEALEKNNMQTFIAEKKEDIVPIVKKLLNDGDTIAMGGCMSANESGVTELVKSGSYKFLDRSAPGLTPKDITDIYRAAFTRDVYIASANAVTENGELYNVDGNSNRVAAILYGPKSVILIVGYNKIVGNIDEAITRVKNVAAPINCVRLGIDNYCAKTGSCVSLAKKGSDMCDGCGSEGRICRNYVVMASQRIKNRIKVILTPEDLGY